MEKNTAIIAGLKTALVILGWLAFFGSYLFPDSLVITIVLQTAARVLP